MLLLLLYPLTLGTWWAITVFGVLVAGVLAWAWWRTRQQRIHYEERLEAWARERAVMDERFKIARELHDLASHGLGVMTVRASTAKFADEQERLVAFDDIERIGRQATDQLRSMLNVLRTSDSDAPMRPLEGIPDLAGIVETARQAGVDVDAAIESTELEDLSPELQVTICAVVREALSNTVRHAGRTRARVAVSAQDDRVRVDVADDGPSPGWRPHPGTGHGLAGLRERVAVHDGMLTAAPAEDGFRLVAELPRGRAS
ncbi:sensor histidine kinase [Brachybacterium fresconis]|uniref:histidine kinase n=2 Tax=Brachybacterium fresconis TaxID=173363 RepID=A0ABS4YGC3_9MICO|nr:histidine kinase [Brachybacterium fresconis]MBP2407846.1 signal transduction histidine kinase [Brachybacterium fresconis]